MQNAKSNASTQAGSPESTAKPEATSSEQPSEVSTTTEPPVQLVKDVIDALSAGGLDFILGRAKNPSASAEDMIQRRYGKLSWN
jgi:hypothetical protein